MICHDANYTEFLYLGDWLGWLSLAGWIFFVVFEVVENRRHKKQAQEKADAASSDPGEGAD
jgi:hypothetical protein